MISAPDTSTEAKKEPTKTGSKKDEKAQKKTDKNADQESEMKKKQASAKEIDKAQSKRLIKTKRTIAKKGKKTVRAVKPTIEPRNIGIEVTPPEDSCDDPFCPFHGILSVRGQILNGVVMSSKMDKTAIIQREVKRYIPKYERYEKRTHNYAVHNPKCLNAKRGDMVRIMECRPLSKTKSFVIVEKI